MKKIAKYYKNFNDKIQCVLCPHECILSEGKFGKCKVRKNISGNLISENYGKICSINSDPIEKKPLYHFFPSKNILSIGSIGCNLSCNFCQNSEISQVKIDDFEFLEKKYPQNIVNYALKIPNNIGIAYTYNEPIVWFEFMKETSEIAKEKGLKNVMVSNGFINKKPLSELLNYIDAFNIDLKSYSDIFYKKQTSARLNPILENLKEIKKSGKHLEITNLIIPTLNDDFSIFEKMIKMLANDLGKDTVFHISRYFPRYKSTIYATPPNTLMNLYSIAKKYLNHVYLGNIFTETGQNTICPKCKNILIKRTGYKTSLVGINNKNKCIFCGNKTSVIS